MSLDGPSADLMGWQQQPLLWYAALLWLDAHSTANILLIRGVIPEGSDFTHIAVNFLKEKRGRYRSKAAIHRALATET